jgi:ketosteroid isomerase-like protein
MKASILALALFAGLLAGPARADWSDEVRAAYELFAGAQNARDLRKVNELLLDAPHFLWVSDGMSVWGRDAALERMGAFQEAEIWRVEPDLGRAVPVRVSDTTAFLHLPLTLVIGSQPSPDRVRFLVSVLCVRAAEGWRIAALFTTAEKPG